MEQRTVEHEQAQRASEAELVGSFQFKPMNRCGSRLKYAS